MYYLKGIYSHAINKPKTEMNLINFSHEIFLKKCDDDEENWHYVMSGIYMLIEFILIDWIL